MTTLGDRIAEIRREIDASPAADLAEIIGQLEALKASAFAQLVNSAGAGALCLAPEEDGDRLVDVDEVATKLGETSRWVREHKHLLPLVDFPGRGLKFSAKRLEAWMKRRAYG